MMTQIISAAFGVLVSAVVFEAPRHLLKYIAIIGASGWAFFLLLVQPFGPHFATYFSGLLVAFASHIAARTLKAPVTVFFIPGFFPLVPGAGMFRIAYWFISGDVALGQHYLFETIVTAGMIALAIFTIDSIFNGYSRILGLLKKSKL